MTIVDDLTPTQYSLGDGKMIVRGKSLATIRFTLLVAFYSANGDSLGSRYFNVPFTDPQKQAFLSAIADVISDLETDTGLTEYVEPPPIP